MTTDPHLSSNHLLRDFDVLLDQHQRVQKENDLLRIELMRHPSGAMQIRSVSAIARCPNPSSLRFGGRDPASAMEHLKPFMVSARF